MSSPALRVLVVDDDALTRIALEGAIRQSGANVRVETAASGEEALTKIRAARAEHHAFGLLLTDQHMPGIEGTELMRRAHEESPETQAALFTADPADAQAQLARSTAFAFFEKPIDPREIQELVRAIALANGATATLR